MLLCAFTQHHHQRRVSLSPARVARVTSFLWRWKKKKLDRRPGSVASPGPPDVWTQLSPVTLVTTGRRSVTTACPPLQGSRAVRSAVEWGRMWSHTRLPHTVWAITLTFFISRHRTTTHSDESVQSTTREGNISQLVHTRIQLLVGKFWTRFHPPDSVICTGLPCF